MSAGRFLSEGIYQVTLQTCICVVHANIEVASDRSCFITIEAKAARQIVVNEKLKDLALPLSFQIRTDLIYGLIAV